MQQPIIHTKVVIPRRRPDLLSRPRLLDLLHDLVDYRLILAVAPAGYGKTSLFIDFAHQADMKVCWYSVDESDADFPQFFAYFVSAIVRRFPHLADSVLARPEMLLLNRLAVTQLVTIVVNELYEKIHEHFLVVVDDYHLVSGSAEIEQFISQFVQLCGEHCHLALLSRTLLSLSDLPLMIARAYVGGLSFEELRFQKDEIHDLLAQKYGVQLSEAEVTALFQSTEGWITGLLLSSLRNNSEITNWARLSRVSGIDLYSYLAQQVLNRQPQEIRQFLLRTSFLEEFNASLCELILGKAPPGETWQGMIDTIFHDNLFVLGVGESGSWVRYHHLFQQFLQKTLDLEAPEEAKRIQYELAEYYAQSGNWERSYLIYQSLSDLKAVANLVKNAGTPLLKSGRYYVLSKWLDALPTDVRKNDPLLMSLYGIVSVNIGQVENGLQYLNQAVEALASAQQPLALAQTLVRRALTYYQTGSYQLALNDIGRVLTLMEDLHEEETDLFTQLITNVKAEAHRLQGLCDYVVGNYSAAIRRLEQARHIYTYLNDLRNDTIVAMEIAMAHAGTGNYQKALSFFEEVLQNWRNLHNVVGQASVLNNLGVLYHLRGEYQTAIARLLEALEYSKRSGFTRMEAYTLASIGDIFADLKVTAVATEFYERSYPLARSVNERFLLLHLNLALLLLALPKDRQQDAKIFLDAATRLVSEEKSPFEHGLFRMVVGQYHLLGGRKHDAIAPLQEAVDSLAKTDQRVEFAKAHLFLGVAHHDSGNRSRAVEAIAQGIKIAAGLENWHPLVTAGHTISAVLETIQVEGECKTGLERLLAQVRTFNQNSPETRRQLRQQIEPFLSNASAKRPQLQIRTLGRGEVTFNGKVIENSDWQTQSARDLFFCFIAHEDGLTKEEVGEIFWSDSSPGQLKTRFKNAIYRLRSALDQEVVIFDNDLYYFNRTLDYEYDVETFERAIAAARGATIEEKRTALLRVHELYQGDYLPELDPAWAQLERERLRRLHVDAMLELAEIYLQTGDPMSALARCQALLAADPCLESAHRLCMRAHSQRGNRADIARQYEQCYTALLDEFGVPPSPETEALYDQLMA